MARLPVVDHFLGMHRRIEACALSSLLDAHHHAPAQVIYPATPWPEPRLLRGPLKDGEDLLRAHLVLPEATRTRQRHEEGLSLKLWQKGLLAFEEASHRFRSIDPRADRHAALVARLLLPCRERQSNLGLAHALVLDLE